MSRVNYYQSAFNSQKEKLNILAEILEISKSGCCAADLYIIEHRHYQSSCRQINVFVMFLDTFEKCLKIGETIFLLFIDTFEHCFKIRKQLSLLSKFFPFLDTFQSQITPVQDLIKDKKGYVTNTWYRMTLQMFVNNDFA